MDKIKNILGFIENNFKNGNTTIQIDNMKLLIAYFNDNNIVLNDNNQIELLLQKSNKLIKMLSILISSDDKTIYEDENIKAILERYLEKLNVIDNNNQLELGDIYRDYTREIAKYRLLTKEEIIALAKRIELGDNDAKTELINANLRLVVNIALTYSHTKDNIMDLIQDGNEGLIEAANEFDYRKGCFSTIATIHIRKRISRGLANKSKAIRIPVYLFFLLPKIKKYIDKYNVVHNENPTPEMIAKELGVNLSIIERALKIEDPISLNQAQTNENGDSYEEMLLNSGDESLIENQPENIIFNKELMDFIFNTNILENREKRVLIYRYGLVDGIIRTQEQVSEMLGISRKRVDDIEKVALVKLRYNPFIHPYYDKDTEKYTMDISKISKKELFRLYKTR